jgi:hypothetical protein
VSSRVVHRLTRRARHWWNATPNSHVLTVIASVVIVVVVVGGALIEIH